MMKIFDLCPDKIRLIFILSAIFLPVAACFSQNIASSRLIWQTDSARDMQTDKTISYQAKIKTNGTESVLWIQRQGERSSTYTVTGTEGSWTDISTRGSFTYLLRKNGNDARMTFEKNLRGTFITLDFSKPGVHTFRQRLQIQSVTTAN